MDNQLSIEEEAGIIEEEQAMFRGIASHIESFEKKRIPNDSFKSI